MTILQDGHTRPPGKRSQKGVRALLLGAELLNTVEPAMLGRCSRHSGYGRDYVHRLEMDSSPAVYGDGPASAIGFTPQDTALGAMPLLGEASLHRDGNGPKTPILRPERPDARKTPIFITSCP